MRNIIAGMLVGYGLVSCFCFIGLVLIWAGAAPRFPNAALGLVYRHNEHGSYSYFSAFQATACWLMFATSIPLAFAGGLIAPKKTIKGSFRWFGGSLTWDQDDPKHFGKWAALASAAAAPLLVFWLGPHIVRA
jgi:hypothetical protein